MLHRTTDPASRSPFQGLAACLVAAVVCGYTGHYGMTLLAAGMALLSARRLVWPRPSARRAAVLLAQAGWVIRAVAASLRPRLVVRRALPVRALHLSR